MSCNSPLCDVNSGNVLGTLVLPPVETVRHVVEWVSVLG